MVHCILLHNLLLGPGPSQDVLFAVQKGGFRPQGGLTYPFTVYIYSAISLNSIVALLSIDVMSLSVDTINYAMCIISLPLDTVIP